MQPLVNIFVCGVQKGGTTSLNSYLRDHPDLAAPDKKEVHFFDKESIRWRNPNYDSLHRLYPGPNGQRYAVSPNYAYWPPSIERMSAYNPRSKLIYIFRDPIERAWSNWSMEYARGKDDWLFADAIRHGRERTRSAERPQWHFCTFGYVERGFYLEQVERALRHFPRDQLLFLRSQDLSGKPEETLARVSEFLGLHEFPDTAPRRERPRREISYPSELTGGDIDYLASLYRDDLTSFAALTDLDVSEWLTMRA